MVKKTKTTGIRNAAGTTSSKRLTKQLQELDKKICTLYAVLIGPVPDGTSPVQLVERVTAEMQLRQELHDVAENKKAAHALATCAVIRERLPNERPGISHKFTIGGRSGYLSTGQFADGRVGELFVRMEKAGSTINGLTDAVAIAVSIGLQHGVPVDVFVRKFVGTRFEPDGFTPYPDIPIAKSVLDYVFRWIGLHYCPDEVPKPVPEIEENGPSQTLSESCASPDC